MGKAIKQNAPCLCYPPLAAGSGDMRGEERGETKACWLLTSVALLTLGSVRLFTSLADIPRHA